MTERELKGSYLGFTYNGIHSSTLGITRISVSNRQSINLLPTLKDSTGNIEGVDGVTYFGTKYTKREIPVNFAFENLSQQQLELIKTLFDSKEISSLIFDEHPYKVYSAKVTSQVITKYVVFSNDGIDYYKGEGSLTFTCYFPFARGRYQWQEDYIVDNILEWQDENNNFDYEAEGWEEVSDDADAYTGHLYYDFDIDQEIVGSVVELSENFDWIEPKSLFIYKSQSLPNSNSGVTIFRYKPTSLINYNDWITSSKIPSHANYGKYNPSTHSIKLFNAGDVLMPTRWWFRINHYDTYNITLTCNGKTLSLVNLHYLQMNSPTGAGGDQWIVIDMANSMIYGYDAYDRFTGRFYEQFMRGEYFGIPTGEATVYITGAIPDKKRKNPIEFQYLYL